MCKDMQRSISPSEIVYFGFDFYSIQPAVCANHFSRSFLLKASLPYQVIDYRIMPGYGMEFGGFQVFLEEWVRVRGLAK